MFASGDWKDTFQRIAIVIDKLLQEKGAKALAPRGEADVTEGSILSDFDAWQTDCLWPGISEVYSTPSASGPSNSGDVFDFARFTANNTKARTHILEAKIVDVKTLTASEVRPKYHMEIKIPDDVHYKVGDYLEVYPENSPGDRDILMEVLHARGEDLEDPLISTMCTYLELGHQASLKVWMCFLRCNSFRHVF